MLMACFVRQTANYSIIIYSIYNITQIYFSRVFIILNNMTSSFSHIHFVIAIHYAMRVILH